MAHDEHDFHGMNRTRSFWGWQDEMPTTRVSTTNDDLAHRRRSDAPGSQTDRARRIARSHARRAAEVRLEREEEQEWEREQADLPVSEPNEPNEEVLPAQPQPRGRIVHPSASNMDRALRAGHVGARRSSHALPESSRVEAARRRASLPDTTDDVSVVEPVLLPLEQEQAQARDELTRNLSVRTSADYGPARAHLPAPHEAPREALPAGPAATQPSATPEKTPAETPVERSPRLHEDAESRPTQTSTPRERAPRPRPPYEDAAPQVDIPPVATPQRRPLFWMLYALLVVILTAGVAGVCVYTYSSLVKYESSQPKNVMQGYILALQEGGAAAEEFEQQCFASNKIGALDSPELLSARFSEGVGKHTYRFEECGPAFDTSAPVYTIYADDEPFLTLRLAPERSHVSLGLLNITDWGIRSALLHSAALSAAEAANVDGGASCNIAVPYNAQVVLNGQKLDDAYRMGEETVLPGFEYASQFVEVPTSVSYHVEGLHAAPEVLVYDYEGDPIELRQSGLSFTAATFAEPNRTADQLPVDPLAIGETWSKFMTADLTGASHGVAKVTAFLIPGSELHTLATSFANSIDITFVSTHVIDSWTEEEVSNCVMYNDRLFSCDVHFVKNMTLNTGVTRADEFNNTMIFAYVDDESVDDPGWYLVNMQAIT